MTPGALFLIFVSLATLTAGQIGLKLALADEPPRSRRWRVVVFATGILGMTISFFVSLGLMQKLELSQVFPFQGLSVLVVTILASLFLKERLTLPLIVGTLLITAGVMLVSAS